MPQTERIAITPEFRQVQRYIRLNEERFYDELLRAGELTGLGRGVLLNSFSSIATGEFTGRGLCLLASARWKEEIEENFPVIRSVVTAGYVNPYDSFREEKAELAHYWLRLFLKGTEPILIDPTYGQMHPWLSTVVDFQNNEPRYYGKNYCVIPSAERRNSQEILRDMIRDWQFTRISQPLINAY